LVVVYINEPLKKVYEGLGIMTFNVKLPLGISCMENNILNLMLYKLRVGAYMLLLE
jgi:hypothetical protein